MHQDSDTIDFYTSGHEEAQWISLSDLMTGLMMMFLLIAIMFMLKVQADAKAQANAVANAISNEPIKNEGVPPAPALTAVAQNNGQAAASASQNSVSAGTPQTSPSYDAITKYLEAKPQLPVSGGAKTNVSAPVTIQASSHNTASSATCDPKQHIAETK